MADSDLGKYEKTLVSYLDILGFAELLNERSAAEIANLLITVKRSFAAGGRVHRNRNDEVVRIFKWFNFSDLIVRTTRIEAEEEINRIVDWEVYYLSEMQLSMALDGILIRGAICVGDLFAKSEESIVFGPALVKAYRLEREYAIYPRIVIDRDVIWEAEERGYIAHWQDYCLRGEDGAYFVDYFFGASLTGLEIGFPGDQPNARERIQAHRDMIVNFIEERTRAEKGRASERIKQKWIWLALYHNSTIRRLKERLQRSPRGQDLDRFLISEELLKF